MKNVLWLARTSLYSLVLSAMCSNNFLSSLFVTTEKAGFSAMSPTPKEKVRQQTKVRQGSTRIYPQAIASQPNRLMTVLSETVGAQQVYQCREADGKTVFSDQPCGDIERVISVTQLQPNAADHYQALTHNASAAVVTKSNQTDPQRRNPADQQEINTRYRNLGRVIRSLLKNNQGGLRHLLIKLDQDRREALSMHERSVDSYAVNQYFDNLTRDIRHRPPQSNQITIAKQLLKLERQRNKELYTH